MDAPTLSRSFTETWQKPSSNGVVPHGSSETTRADYCLRQAGIILGSYRKGAADDPEAYLTATAAVLSRYPQDVVAEVADPFKGIQTQHTFPPNPAEVREACEVVMRPRRAAEQRDANLVKQLREREEYDRTRATAAKLTYDELKAKHGPSWGLAGIEGEDEDSKQKRAALFARVNRRVHGDVSEWHVSPILAETVSKGA